MKRFIWLPLAQYALVVGALSAGAQELETIPPAENANIGEISAKALAQLQKRYPESEKSLVRRDAHAKAHGCVRAIFKVDPNIPQSLRVGTFSQPGRRFKALMRFSNGAFEPGPDTGQDGRGVAVKIIDADPDETSPARQGAPHDLLMINYPVFFSPDVADYLDFAQSGALTGAAEGLKKYFIPGYNPFHWRLRQAYIAYLIASQKISSPLSAQYYSMVPFAFGPGRAVKYSARRCAAAPLELRQQAVGPNFLRIALRDSLAAAEGCFELLVQEQLPGMQIEDATAEWPESVSPFRRVGEIDIPSQVITDARDQDCESLIFNPWNAPNDQKPLGGINRLRKDIYDKISKYRTERNGVVPKDSNVLWNEFK